MRVYFCGRTHHIRIEMRLSVTIELNVQSQKKKEEEEMQSGAMLTGIPEVDLGIECVCREVVVVCASPVCRCVYFVYA